MTKGYIGDDPPHGFEIAPPRVAKIVDLRYQSIPMVGRGFQWWPELHHDGVIYEGEKAYVVDEDGIKTRLKPGDFVMHIDDGNPYDGHERYEVIDETTFKSLFEPIPDGAGTFRTKVLVEVRSIAADLEGDAKAHALANPMSSGDGYVIGEDVSADAIIHVMQCELVGAILLAKGFGYEQHPDHPDELTPKRKQIIDLIQAAVSAAMLEV